MSLKHYDFKSNTNLDVCDEVKYLQVQNREQID